MNEKVKKRFPVLAIYMGLCSLTIAQGLQMLFMGDEIFIALVAILIGIPPLISAYSLWTGKYWSYKALILTFSMYFILAIYEYWNEEDIGLTQLLILFLGYTVISIIIIRYVYKNTIMPSNNAPQSTAESGG